MKKTYYKAVLLFLLSALIQLSLNAQNWQWGESISSDGNVVTVDIETDASHNVYIVGIVKDATSFTIGTDIYSIKGNNDVFICSFSSEGVYRWSRQLAGNGNDEVTGIAVDQHDSLYVVGGFRDEAIYFTTTDSLENTGTFDSFIAKYSTNGDLSYMKRIFWGINAQRIQGVAIDEVKEEIALIGWFKEQITYYNGVTNVSIPVVGVKDLFVATFSYDSIFKDITIYNTSDKYSNLKNIAICTAGGYFVTGDLRGRINFTGSDFIEGEGVNADALIIRVDDNLDYLWSRLGRGTGYDHVNWAVSDIYSNIYITGKTESSPTTFDSTDVLAGAPLAAYGGSDMYIAKYNRSGVLQWARRNGDSGNDNAYGADISDDLLYVIGNFAGEVVFGQDTINTGSVTNVDFGFGVMDTDGNAISLKITSGTLEDIGTGLVVGGLGEVNVTGYYASPVLTAGSINLNNALSPNTEGLILGYQFPFSATFTRVQQISCNGGSDGELTVTPYFGQPPYTFAWDHDGGLSDSTATALPAGSYRVVITDNNSETAEASITLTEPTAIDIAGTISDVLCNTGNDGGIDITVTGGTGTTTYLWSTTDGSGLNPTAEDQSALTAGTYDIEVTDENGCNQNESFIVAEPDAITFGGSIVTDIVTPPGANGAIDLMVAGGTAPYTYSWTGPNSFTSDSEDISALTDEGNYIITITDAGNCSADTSFMIISNTQELMAFINIKKDVSCHGGNDGEATVTVIGSQGTLHYVWRDSENHIIGKDSSTIIGLQAGHYQVTAYDYRKCHAYAEVTINEPEAALEGVIVVQDVNCYNEQNGIADLTVTGGTPPYTFEWSTGSTSEDINNLAAGRYELSISDQNACTFQTFAIVSEPEPIQTELSLENELSCYGDRNAIVTVSVSGGNEPYAFLWNDQASQITPTATGLEAGNYSVTITDANGCLKTEEIEIEEPAQLIISFNKSDVSCFNGNDGTIDALVQGGIQAYDYLWSNGETGSTINNVVAGTYSLMVTDQNQCQETNNTEIIHPPEILFDSLQFEDESAAGANDGTITIFASGGTAPLSYILDPGQIQNQTGEFTGLQSGTYNVNISDANSCGPVNTGDIFIGSLMIDDKDLNNMISVYPNPSSGHIIISINNAMNKDMQLEIININGEIIYKEEFLANSKEDIVKKIDISDQPKGIYLMKVSGKELLKTLKIILK